MAAPLTEAAIQQVRQLIATGQLVPGQRLPPEAELAESLGTSRSTVREAVRALVTARVLDVRRGDGTYVTSLRPELLLAGIGAAADLLQDGFTLELLQVRRILEPAATRMAASSHQRRHARRTRRLLTSDVCGRIAGRAGPVRRGVPSAGGHHHGQRHPGVDAHRRVEPHHAWSSVARASSKPEPPSAPSPSTPPSSSALRARDPELAEAAALVHVSTTEAWFRSVLQTEDEPDADANPEPPA